MSFIGWLVNVGYKRIIYLYINFVISVSYFIVLCFMFYIEW